MKKVLLMLAITLGIAVGATAQTKSYIQGGVGVSSTVFNQSLELGVKKGSYQLALVGETFRVTPQERQYFTGVKFAKNFKSGIQAFGAAKIHVNSDTYGLQFEPGVAYNLALGKNVILQPKLSTKIFEGKDLFKPVALNAGVDLQITL